MSPVQELRQIIAVLKALQWADSPTRKVYGSDVVEVIEVEEETLLGSFPQCLVTVGNATSDDEEPGLVSQDFGIHPVVDVGGDATGSASLTGASRGDGVGSSQGKGVLELASVTCDALRRLTGADGLPILVEAQGMPKVARLGEEKSVAYMDILVRALCTAADEYEAPRNLIVSGGIAGHATITWANPSSRFDYRETVIVRKSGSSAPTSVGDGTIVYQGPLLTFDDACGAGTFTWAAFAAYTYTGAATNEHYSPASEVGSTRTKAIT
jgi:hypothetical protein